MPDLAKNLYLEDVGQPCSQLLLAHELDSTTGASGAELSHIPTLATDNVATNNHVQQYVTANISTTAEPAATDVG